MGELEGEGPAAQPTADAASPPAAAGGDGREVAADTADEADDDADASSGPPSRASPALAPHARELPPTVALLPNESISSDLGGAFADDEAGSAAPTPKAGAPPPGDVAEASHEEGDSSNSEPVHTSARAGAAPLTEAAVSAAPDAPGDAGGSNGRGENGSDASGKRASLPSRESAM